MAGGNWIVDQIKLVEQWPEQDGLAGITDELRGNGGSPYNVLVDLARLGAGFPLEGVGLLGDDEYGRWIEADCAAHRIDTRQLIRAPGLATSYTDVITVRSTGRRTFFHRRGANAVLTPDHFRLEGSHARFFHLGYLMLLDALDAPGQDGRPQACRVLGEARRLGMQTSADLVSDTRGRFAEVVLPVLPFLDLLFVNDYEAQQTTGVALRHGGRLDPVSVGHAARLLARGGVRQWVVIHFPEGAYACSPGGSGLWQPALKVPPTEIRGAAGAGDAFAAGVLFGLHEQWPMQRCLLLGVAAAATSLLHPTCSQGVKSGDDCLKFAKATGFQPLPH